MIDYSSAADVIRDQVSRMGYIRALAFALLAGMFAHAGIGLNTEISLLSAFGTFIVYREWEISDCISRIMDIFDDHEEWLRETGGEERRKWRARRSLRDE